jgi:hypothetical protein
MAKRRSEIGKKGKHGRSGVEIARDRAAKRRRNMIIILIVLAVATALILASAYLFLIPEEKDEDEEESDVISTDTPIMGVYPNESVSFGFTIYNPDAESDVFSPLISGLPSDWLVDLPNTIDVGSKESKEEQFTITPSFATAYNGTYAFRLNVTSANTQHTYTQEYEIIVFELQFDVELTTDTPHKKGNPGENFTFNFTIYNPRGEPDKFFPLIYGLPSDWEITVPLNISVGGNDSAQDTFYIVPSLDNALNKTHSFLLNVTSMNILRTYSLEFNLTIFQNIWGVELACYNNSHDVDPGRSTHYAVVVRNTGNGDDTMNLSYNESHLPNNWTFSFEFDSVDISGYDAKVVICNITSYSGTSPGRYDILIKATSSTGLTDTFWLNTSRVKVFGDETAAVDNNVKVDYIGMFEDGVIFDTSVSEVAHNDDYPKKDDFTPRASYSPLLVYVGPQDPDSEDDYIQVIPGFWEGIVGMEVNETWVTRIPPEKAYNTPGHPLYGKTLIFEINLVSIDN